MNVEAGTKERVGTCGQREIALKEINQTAALQAKDLCHP